MLWSAQACAQQSRPGFYVGGSAGPNFAGSLVSLTGNTNTQTNVGPVAILDLGYRFGNGLRAEIEGDYRSNAASAILTRRINGNLLPMSNVGGAPATYGFMANAVYDLPLGGFKLPFTPYVGGGIGYSRVDFSNVSGTEPTLFQLAGGNTYSGNGLRTNGSADAFAYQAIVGASAPLSFVPGLEATVEYRYFATTRVTIQNSTRATGSIIINGSTPSASGSMQVVARDSAVLFGLRYTFNQPKV